MLHGPVPVPPFDGVPLEELTYDYLMQHRDQVQHLIDRGKRGREEKKKKKSVEDSVSLLVFFKRL